MKKIWKSYAVFSSRIYRLMTLLVIPVIFIIGGFELFTLIKTDMMMTGFKLFVSLILTYEVINDYWLFSGICTSEASAVESLKLSMRGRNVLKNALMFDLFKRFVCLLAAGLIAYAKTGMLSLLLTALCGYIVLVIMLNVTRYLSTILMQITMSQLAVALFQLTMMLFSNFNMVDANGYMGVILLPLLVVCFALGVATVAHIQGRWKESYYEK